MRLYSNKVWNNSWENDLQEEEEKAAAAKPPSENGRSSRASVNGEGSAPGSVRGRSPAMSCSASVFGDDNPPAFTTGKAMRQEGQRNLQDSTFSISGNTLGLLLYN